MNGPSADAHALVHQKDPLGPELLFDTFCRFKLLKSQECESADVSLRLDARTPYSTRNLTTHEDLSNDWLLYLPIKGNTRRGESQSLKNSWLYEDTHDLEAHNAGRVSP